MHLNGQNGEGGGQDRRGLEAGRIYECEGLIPGCRGYFARATDGQILGGVRIVWPGQSPARTLVELRREIEKYAERRALLRLVGPTPASGRARPALAEMTPATALLFLRARLPA